jgi:hypothetical protein
MKSVLVAACFALATSCVGVDRAEAQPTQTSTLCKFTSGPRTGQTQDYAPQAPLPVGTPCQDGAGSFGTVVAPSGSTSSTPAASAARSTLCKFTSGPRTGQTQDYAPQPALPIGTPCWDGTSSSGVVVAPTTATPTPRTSPPPSAPASGASTLCRFTSGPRAGQTQDYAPQAPLPVGSPCWDGVASNGVIVAKTPTNGPSPAPNSMSTLCKFNSGPRAGQTQDYAPQPPLKVGTPCWDGITSSGVVVVSSP